ncbi:MAG: PAS domain-containing protein [Candidatus Zixiibacteriota bacterium]|nr:MAG: PAS domain-containing protein [candidate division Zixibacteria bacterium]
MAFKNFRLVCSIRIALVAITIGVVFYLAIFTQLLATTIVVAIVGVSQVWALIRYVDRTNRDLSRFLLAVRHSDFTQAFTPLKLGGSHDELRETFSHVMQEFHKTRQEKEEHFHYLQTVVRHVGIGLIVFDSDGKIDLINAAAKRLLGITGLRTLSDLRAAYPGLADQLPSLQAGSRTVVKIVVRGELLQVSLRATRLRMREQTYRLVSLQDISSELAETEMQAWQQLVRVLTHEIMNSVTPIASLSSTIRSMLVPDNHDRSEARSRAPLTGEKVNDVRTAIDTIEKRSTGLLHFVQAYRDISRIPKPSFQIVPVKELLDRASRLLASREDAAGIDTVISVDPSSLEVTADPELVEQVLINLTVNAVQAMQKRHDSRLDLIARLSEGGRVVIQVVDNGPGIEGETLEAVFIPFFSTKPEGMGIGLSLARQIMRLHKGEITVSSQPNIRTAFTLRF